MKKILLTISLIATLNAQPMYEQEVKKLHFAASLLIASTVTAYARNNGCGKTEAFLYGVGVSLLAGVAKEAYDQYDYGGASADDMYADMGGAVLGSVISTQFSWRF